MNWGLSERFQIERTSGAKPLDRSVPGVIRNSKEVGGTREGSVREEIKEYTLEH